MERERTLRLLLRICFFVILKYKEVRSNFFAGDAVNGQKIDSNKRKYKKIDLYYLKRYIGMYTLRVNSLISEKRKQFKQYLHNNFKYKNKE